MYPIIWLVLLGISRALIIRHPSQGDVVDVKEYLNITWDLTNQDDMDLNASVRLTIYDTNPHYYLSEEITTVPIAMHHLIWNKSLPFGDHYAITLIDVQGIFSSGNFTVINGPTHTIPPITSYLTSTAAASSSIVDWQSKTSAAAPLTQLSTSVTQAPSALPSTTSEPANSRLSSGSKAGVGVGVSVSAIVLAGGLAYFFIRRRRQKQEQGQSNQSYDRQIAGGHIDEPKAVPPPNYYSAPPVSPEADSRPLSELHSNTIAHELAA
ncbi:uncharacterized protein TRUGW13939_06835 [Talaromyces rugulosus]|uniref:Mid2 domain-containing protein n=1 Tax=Talaromyces rugulosus TaxID=121627 RepID=A0A7H8R1W2_TALRU|nr:uncharacterized protein TRUGW13939_06835 [Talaromyces rugulosus]QKX59695.1 hypothetical protein TRUGW13939_06835 [Talaromyces rugulosus]